MTGQELTCKCPEGSCGHHSPPVPARYVTTRQQLTEALRKAQAGRLYVTDTPSAADALLEYLTPFAATVPPDLRERIDAALGESLDLCARCKVCDAQLDAVMAVIGPHFERLAELDNAISWATSCLSCPAVLDSCYRETARAERAEEELSALKAEPAAVPEPVMVLLEDAWALISVTGDGGDPMRYETWTEKAAAWRVRYESVVLAHAAVPAREAAGEPDTESAPPLPPGEYARVEIKGHDSEFGWVTERTRAGVVVMVVSDWDGRVKAEVPGSSMHKFVPLPTPLKRPEPQRAITSGTFTATSAEYGYDDGYGHDYHVPRCPGDCAGECTEGAPF